MAVKARVRAEDVLAALSVQRNCKGERVLKDYQDPSVLRLYQYCKVIVFPEKLRNQDRYTLGSE